ncbi:MAG TPA: DUF4340 domain-containing protein [Verrucomicrobiae bacterium]|nr:DUF4340 domain-containing protein [Verrucomicrobiae bacterium]
MNWKPTWVLLTATAVVFAFIVLVERPIRLERLRQASRSVLPGLDPATVTNVEIQPWGQSSIHAERRLGSKVWRLTAPIEYPARGAQIDALLDSLAKLEWKDRISDQELRDRPDAQEQYGFVKPRFSILLQAGGVDRRLEIGDLSPLGDEVFLNLVGSTAICLANADLMKMIPQDKDQWRDLSLLDVTNMPFDELTVRTAAKEKLDLRRDPTNHLWFMNRPWLARADSDVVNALLNELQHLPVVSFVSDDPQADLESFGLQSSPQTPTLTLVFSNGANLAAVLQIGASPTNHPEFAYARRRDPSNVVLVARGPFRAWQADNTNFLDQHLISFSPDWIESIEARGQNAFAVRKQTNGQWDVEAPHGKSFPADAELMKDWLEGLSGIPTSIEKTVVADLSPYGLSRPALRYSIKFGPKAGSRAVAHVEFGTNQNGQVFERRTDEDFVNTIGLDEFGRLPYASWQMRDRRIWNFATSNVISVTIHQLGGTRKFMRDPDGAWTFAPGYKGPPFINSPELEEAVHRIGRLTAIYWDGHGDTHLERFGFAQADHNIEFEIKGPNGSKTLRIAFGSRSPYTHPYATVVEDGERLIFEFPADLYENFVEHDLMIPAALR